MPYSSIYVTTADRAEAIRIGKALVEQRLAACANVIDGIASIYWWQGAVVEGAEAALILKTKRTLVPAAVAAVKQLHSYTVPCIVEWRIGAINPAYGHWIAEETKPARRAPAKRRSRR